MGLIAGTRFGPYEIQSPLGAGGMGEVYKARDVRLDRTVAIKILTEALTGDPQFRDRFDREARIISQLTHPHICTLHDVGEQSGTAFLVMEYLQGETLADRLKRGALPLDDALTIATQIADALAAAHRMSIVHRDLKPGNVMLTRAGAKLLDFGLAKTAAQTPAAGLSMLPTTPPNLTAQGTILGTLQYMSPEQLEGGNADNRSDIFALGAIVYEMLTGKKAFEAKSQASLIHAIIGVEPPPIATLRPLAPPLLDHWISRTLAKNPDDRWQSARDARVELEWLQRPDAIDRGPQRARTGLRNVVAWALAGMFAAATGAVTWLNLRRAPEDQPVVMLSLYATEAELDTFAVSPDGRLLAFNGADASGHLQLYVRALDSLNARALPGTDGAEFPLWSPDSRYIAYTTRGQLHRIAASGGPPQRIVDRDATRGAAWTRAGTIIFTPGSFGGLLQVAADGGNPTPLTVLDASRLETSHRWPAVLPDGRHYLFTIRSAQTDTAGIYLGVFGSPQRTRLVGDISNAAYATAADGTGYLLFARGRSLLAQLLDVERRHLAGDPTVIADNIWFSTIWSRGAYSLSDRGVLVFDSVGRGRDHELTWFDRKGARRGTVGQFGATKVSLSPDELRLALNGLDPQSGTLKLWTVDLTRDTSSRMASTSNDNENSPVWSPDGSRIAFASGRSIFERNSSGAGDVSRLLETDNPVFIQDWSRDGRFLLFRKENPLAKRDLWVLPMSSDRNRAPFPFAQSPSDEDEAAFSPDGQWIAYSSDESAIREVYVQPFVESGSARRWQVSRGGGRYPRWRRDGRELFYLSNDVSKMMAVRIGGGTTFDAGIPTTLFAGRLNAFITPGFAVTGDGQRFLMQVPLAADGAAPVTVVLNWPVALRK